MEITTEKYVRKPLYVDAVRVTKENFDAVAAWCTGEVQTDPTTNRNDKRFIRVAVNHPKYPRQTQAFVGDWILYTERGYKVYTNKNFRSTFDRHIGERILEQVKEEEELTQDEARVSTPIAPPPTPAIVPPTEEERVAGGFEPVQPIESVEELPPYIPGATEREPVVGPNSGTDHLDGGPEERAKPLTEQPAAISAAGKRVLSLEEQQTLRQDEIEELIRSGDAILVQDLPEPTETTA